MKTTHQIKEKLVHTTIECGRISDLLREDSSLINEKYVHSNGVTTNADMTNKEALSKYVSEKMLLTWILT